VGQLRTVVLGQPPVEVEAFLERRRALGQDRFDEVWEGVHHVAPASHAWHGYLDNVLAELLGRLQWFVRAGSVYTEAEASDLLGVTVADLAGQIPWPH
jgi:hypothetical protein